MDLDLTAAQVQALAPDASSAVTAKKIAKAALWKSLGASPDALWGEFQGSALYQTQVARLDWSMRCSCPSRKLPCKHALGLLMIAAQSPGALPATSEPEWVRSWLERRAAAQTRKETRKNSEPKPVDAATQAKRAEGQAKRAEKRQDNILGGLDQLDAWLNDLVRQGLARIQGESFVFWDEQARRLVDAQASGLASRVRQISYRVGAGENWAARVLDDLGLLALLSHAYRRVNELDAPLAADVRRLVGLNLDQDDVLEHADLTRDTWAVLAERSEEDERLRTQRAWLRGKNSARTALLLQFAPAGSRFAESLSVGTEFAAELAFWPSAFPQRALIAQRLGLATPAEAPRGQSVTRCLDAFSLNVSRLPWLERDLFVLEKVIPTQSVVPHQSGEQASSVPNTSSERYVVVDLEQRAIPLVGSRHDILLALSGGHPLLLIGEWNGYTLNPLVAWSEGRCHNLQVPE
ncbi:MAG TPA: SWIM zinc finger family protein [Polyangiaceae bacterium]|nr:SWIM zinc finger family protein [Polyangiaceae bacterium]